MGVWNPKYNCPAENKIITGIKVLHPLILQAVAAFLTYYI